MSRAHWHDLTLESNAACERLVGYIFMCALLVMFYLAPQWCMSSPGVLTNSVEVISNNSLRQQSCDLVGEIILHVITPQIAD